MEMSRLRESSFRESEDMRSIKEWCAIVVEWRKRKGFVTDWESFPVKSMLAVSELAEAVESHRHGNLFEGSKPCPTCGYHISPVTEELADVAIRLFDIAGSLGIDLEKEIEAKMERNEGRPIRHGKRY